MEGGRTSGMASRQDEGSFEDALRRLNALELKLTEQVKIDIHDLKQTWIQPKVDRVTRNAFKLFQVREQLKRTKELFVDEERILGEFNKVKELLRTNSMDEEEFEATKETCLFLGAKLAEIRRKQANCYIDNQDLEIVVNKEIMKLKFDDKDFSELDLEQVRASTPVRQMSPTPLERHRSRSREPSPFKFPPFKLGTGTITPGGSFRSGGGTITPGGTIQQGDPHAYFSRPGSSQSVYGGRGADPQLDAFRQALEAKQREDDSPPAERKGGPGDGFILRSASGHVLAKSESSGQLGPAGSSANYFVNERPASALSDMSINVQDGPEFSRPGSRMEAMGDIVSSSLNLLGQSGGSVEPEKLENNDDVDPELIREMEIDMAAEERRKEEELEARVEEEQRRIKEEANKIFKEKEKQKAEEEKERKKQEEERAKEKKEREEKERQEERETKKKEEEKRFQEREEKRKQEKEKRDAEEKRKKDEEERKKEEEKQRKLEEKKEKKRKEEEAAKLKKEEEDRKAEEKAKKLEEKKKKMAEAKAKKEAEEKEKLELKQKEEQKAQELKKVEEEKKALEQMKAEEEKKKEQSLLKEKKSLQKDISDLENELSIESKQKGAAESKAADSKQKPKSRDASKDRNKLQETKKSQEAIKNETAASSKTAAGPAGDKSVAGKDTQSGKKLSTTKDTGKGSEKETETAGSKPRSLSRGRKDDEQAEKTAAGTKGKTIAGKSDPKAADTEEAKPRSLSRGRKPEPTNQAVEEEKKDKPRSVSRGRKDAPSSKEETSSAKADQTAKPRSLSRDGKATLKAETIQGKDISTGGKTSQATGSQQQATARGKPAGVQKDQSGNTNEAVSTGMADSTSASLKPPSKPGSHQTSRSGSPVSILKKGGSRDASRDRASGAAPAQTDLGAAVAEMVSGGEELTGTSSKPPSRTGSLKKSGSFGSSSGAGKRSAFAEKKKISFDNEVEVEQFNTEGEPLNAAKEIFAAIANTSLEAGSSAARRAPTSRGSGAGSDFSPAEPAEYYLPEGGSEFDNEDELMIIIDDERPSSASLRGSGPMSSLMMGGVGDDLEPELAALRSRSQSNERGGGGRGSRSDNRRGSGGNLQKARRTVADEKYPSSGPGRLAKSRSGSAVPELESIIEGERVRSGSGGGGVGQMLSSLEEPRPNSRPDSTGYTHLDEFEMKLAQMETELHKDIVKSEHVDVSEAPGSLTRQNNLWDLSPSASRMAGPAHEEADLDDFGKVASEFRENVHRDMEGTSQEPLYGRILPKSQRNKTTSDGYVINAEQELGTVDHTFVYDIEDNESEYFVVDDEVTGERRRVKKVSFAEEDQQYVIERQGEVKGLGLSKLFGFGPPKPMKSLPGSNKHDSASATSTGAGSQNLAVPTDGSAARNRLSPSMGGRRSTSKEPSPFHDATSPKAFIAAMTGGLVGSKSPETGRRDSSIGSMFGTLLKKGRKGSKSGSRTSSLDRSSQDAYGSDVEYNDDGSVMRTSSRGSEYDDDARSDSSFARRIGRKLKRKPQKVAPVDFDELFARGMALSAQKESANNQDPFKAPTGDQDQTLDIQDPNFQAGAGVGANGANGAGGGVETRYDENGARFTPFELYSADEAFRRTQKEDQGIGYAEKVKSYLDDQANSPRPSVGLTDLTAAGAQQGAERGRKRHKRLTKDGADVAKPDEAANEAARKAAGEKRKVSREYAKPEDIKLSPMVKRDLFTGAEIPPTPDDGSFLKKATEFVASAEVDTELSQPVWPAIAPADKLPPPKQTLNRLSPRPQQQGVGAPVGGMGPAAGQTFNVQAPEGERVAETGALGEQDRAGAKHPPFSPPRPHEPGDKGIPTQLMPDKLMANEEFYDKLRSGLRNMSIEADAEADDQQMNYQKYSHHLGRAEFGTLRKKEPSQPISASRDPSWDRASRQGPISRDISGDRLSRAGGLGAVTTLSRNTSGDKINERMTKLSGTGRKLSRQGSGASADQMQHGIHKSESGVSVGGYHTQRSDSRMSDYSGALPDLEPQLFDDEDGPLLFKDSDQADGHAVHRTQSLLVDGAKAPRPKVPDTTTDVMQRKEEVLRDIAQHKQQIREAKAWIQNGLMGAVGFCVVVYLQSLEMMAGQT